MFVKQESREGSLMRRFEKQGFVRDYSGIEGSRVKSVVAQFGYDEAGYRLKFEQDPTLDSSQIVAIEVVSSETTSLNPQKKASSGDYIPNLSNSELANMVFVLAKNDEQIFVLPCVNAVKSTNAGKPVFVNSTDHRWADSYIELVASGIVITDFSVITLNVWYKPK